MKSMTAGVIVIGLLLSGCVSQAERASTYRSLPSIALCKRVMDVQPASRLRMMSEELQRRGEDCSQFKDVLGNTTVEVK